MKDLANDGARETRKVLRNHTVLYFAHISASGEACLPVCSTPKTIIGIRGNSGTWQRFQPHSSVFPKRKAVRDLHLPRSSLIILSICLRSALCLSAQSTAWSSVTVQENLWKRNATCVVSKSVSVFFSPLFRNRVNWICLSLSGNSLNNNLVSIKYKKH